MAKNIDKNDKKPAETPLKDNQKTIKEDKKVEKKATENAEQNKLLTGDNSDRNIVPATNKETAKTDSKTAKKSAKAKKAKEAKFEEKKGLDKLYVYFTIVNSGVADSVVKVFEDMGCSVSFIQNGTGTASEEVRKALHIQDSRKEVVVSIIRESRLEDIERELAVFFLASKRNKGVAFATKMDAIQGIRLYKFLSQTL